MSESGRFPRWLRVAAWNALMSAVVFLPAFLLVLPMEAMLLGVALDGSVMSNFGSAVPLYVMYVVPVVTGSVIHTVALGVVSPRWGRSRSRLAAVLFAPLLPVSVIVLWAEGGGIILVLRIWSVLVATVAYGSCVRIPRLPANTNRA
jgi:hypothetical protein